jgi:CheY-like chemotaxis protein
MPRILVVDDHHALRELLCHALSSAGYECAMAADGEAAMGLLRTGNIDAMLLDYDMPKMTGVELLAQIRADPVLQGLPVVGMSGYDLDPADARAFTSFLRKPLSPRDVLFLLAQVAPLEPRPS